MKSLSDYEIQRLARHEPERLLEILRDPATDVVTLTFGAEYAGRIPGSREPLIHLLNHSDPLAREGAIYGLVHHLDDEVRALLRLARESDVSPGVRAAAAEALSEPA